MLQQQRKRRRRYLEKLPSPPPAPGVSCTGSGFRQLDQLHSIVEQVLELRQRNAKLFRRVRELERIKALRRLELGSARGCSLPADEEELVFAESLLGSLLENSAVARSPSGSVKASIVIGLRYRGKVGRFVFCIVYVTCGAPTNIPRARACLHALGPLVQL